MPRHDVTPWPSLICTFPQSLHVVDTGYGGVVELGDCIRDHAALDGKEIFHAVIRAKSGVHIGRVDWFGPGVTMRERTRVMTGERRRETDKLFGYAHHQFVETTGDVEDCHTLLECIKGALSPALVSCEVVIQTMMATGTFNRDRAKKLDINAFTPSQYAAAWREATCMAHTRGSRGAGSGFCDPFFGLNERWGCCRWVGTRIRRGSANGTTRAH